MSLYCQNCGHELVNGQPWPKTCLNCKHVSYRNPVPVGVALVPVQDMGSLDPHLGLLVVQRAIPPKIGEFALPSGYMEYSETWQHCCAREVHEETGVEIPEAHIEPFMIRSSNGLLLIFGTARPIALGPWFTDFRPNEEVQKLDVIWEPTQLAFPLHVEAVQAFYGKNRP